MIAFARVRSALLSLGFGLSAFAAAPAAAAAEKVLYTFSGGSDGGGPVGSLAFDATGNLYGTTHFGGITSCGGFAGGGCGVVFELTPSGSTWTQHALYAFADGSDGGFPNAGVIGDAAGNLYGTASTGGSTACSIGCGTVYQLRPSGSGWGEVVLHTFDGSDGQFPNAALLPDGAGGFVSTTWYGGTNGAGTVFRLMRTGHGKYDERVLYSLNGTTDGTSPAAGVIRNAAGDLFGTTYPYNHTTDGTVFELTRRHGVWSDRLLVNFGSGVNGCNPYAGLIADAAGNLYGTTIECGTYGGGVAFELERRHGFRERVLHGFGASGDGSAPYGGLIADAGGNLYGTTVSGGSHGSGVVYELVRSKRSYSERILWNFTGGDDGANPSGSLVSDAAGNLYGGAGGGANGSGVVFEISP